MDRPGLQASEAELIEPLADSMDMYMHGEPLCHDGL
jgi:hypothetical protein